MKRILLLTVLIVGFFINFSYAQRGCCSHHGGVCGYSCCDGSALSAKCGGGSYNTNYTYKKYIDTSCSKYPGTTYNGSMCNCPGDSRGSSSRTSSNQCSNNVLPSLSIPATKKVKKTTKKVTTDTSCSKYPGTTYRENDKMCACANDKAGTSSWTKTNQCNPIQKEKIIKKTPCTTPRGTKISYGKSVIAYSEESVGFGKRCNSIERTCNDGRLNGFENYQYQSCEQEDPKSCNLPRGGNINHGDSVFAYSKYSVLFGSSCDLPIQRVCNNGKLGGSQEHQYQSCNIGQAQSCTTPRGTNVFHGTTVNAYRESEVGFGQTCNNSQSRTCNNGLLNFSYDYKYQSCNIGQAQSCTTPRGTTVSHGTTVNAYSQSTIAFGSTCISPQVKTCNNGTLGFSSSYKYESCSVAAAKECTTPRGTTVSHGTNINAFSVSSVAYGSICPVGENKTCNNGVLGFGTNYKYPSCEPLAAQSCTTPRGTTVSHGTTVNAYSQSTIAFGSTCISPQVKTCNNGTLGFSSSYRYESCSVAAAKECTTPRGTSVPHGTIVNAYIQSTVASGSVCGSPQIRTCNNGSPLGFPSSYKYESCSVL